MESEDKALLARYCDADGVLKLLPRRGPKRDAALAYLASKFETGRDYAEREVNAICERWHSFGDCFLLRRELIEGGYLERERDGSRYWRAEKTDGE
ncbi:MAG: DUF2087 domain-containing protein [Oscillospiraceae bacterium]|nr:DUF2087 domain-containing protein [Oscillospiraceae bacterium]